MTLLVREVIQHARDLHASLSETNAPNALGYRHLSRDIRSLYTKMEGRVQGFDALEVEQALPLASFDAGVDLTTLIPGGWKALSDVFFRSVTTIDSATAWKRGAMVPWEQRDIARAVPGVTFRSNVLYLQGTESDYTDTWTALKVSYTAIPTDVTTPNAAIPLPDDARETLAHSLAAFWVARLVGSPLADVSPQDAAAVQDDARTERRDFLDRITRLAQVQSFEVRDVR